MSQTRRCFAMWLERFLRFWRTPRPSAEIEESELPSPETADTEPAPARTAEIELKILEILERSTRRGAEATWEGELTGELGVPWRSFIGALEQLEKHEVVSIAEPDRLKYGRMVRMTERGWERLARKRSAPGAGDRRRTCVLRAGGRSFDRESFLRDSTFGPVRVYTREGVASPPDDPGGEESGFEAEISSEDLFEQVQDALSFLREHSSELRRLRAFEGVDGVELELRVLRRDGPFRRARFPAELLRLVGEVGIDLSVAPCRTGSKEEESEEEE